MAIVDNTNIEQALELEQIYTGDLFGDRAFPWAWSEVERLSLMYTSFTQLLCSP
jgi:two-component system LytT family response regulator